VVASWASFIIPLGPPGPGSLAGRSGLLVTLFLSLTTLLVSTTVTSPRVDFCFTALTAWLLLQYLFITAAIAAFAVLLWHRRHSGREQAAVERWERDTDSTYILTFVPAYLLSVTIYCIVVTAVR
jgi:hypothetical protein